MTDLLTAPAEAQEAQTISGEELFAMGDIGPCELVDGRIVPMSPTGGRHGLIESNLIAELGSFVRRQRLGWIMGGDVGLYTQHDPDRVRAADVAFWPRERLPDGPPAGFLEVAPELVVEIVSPGDRWLTLRQKIEEYFAIGVDQVWIVEPENRAVLVYRSSTELARLGEDDILAGEGTLEGFSLPMAELLA